MPGDVHRQALGILSQYREVLVTRMAEEVVERRDHLDAPFGVNGEELSTRYGPLLCGLDNCLSALRAACRFPSPPTPVVEVEVLEALLAELTVEWQAWFSAHERVQVVSLQCLPDGPRCRCVNVYSPA